MTEEADEHLRIQLECGRDMLELHRIITLRYNICNVPKAPGEEIAGLERVCRCGSAGAVRLILLNCSSKFVTTLYIQIRKNNLVRKYT